MLVDEPRPPQGIGCNCSGRGRGIPRMHFDWLKNQTIVPDGIVMTAREHIPSTMWVHLMTCGCCKKSWTEEHDSNEPEFDVRQCCGWSGRSVGSIQSDIDDQFHKSWTDAGVVLTWAEEGI